MLTTEEYFTNANMIVADIDELRFCNCCCSFRGSNMAAFPVMVPDLFLLKLCTVL